MIRFPQENHIGHNIYSKGGELLFIIGKKWKDSSEFYALPNWSVPGSLYYSIKIKKLKFSVDERLLGGREAWADLIGVESLHHPQGGPPPPVLEGQEDHRQEHQQENSQERDSADDQDIEVGLNDWKMVDQ